MSDRAATQVSVYRPDLMTRYGLTLPQSWDDVLAFKEKLPASLAIALPLVPAHAWCVLLAWCAAQNGQDFWSQGASRHCPGHPVSKPIANSPIEPRQKSLLRSVTRRRRASPPRPDAGCRPAAFRSTGRSRNSRGYSQSPSGAGADREGGCCKAYLYSPTLVRCQAYVTVQTNRRQTTAHYRNNGHVGECIGWGSNGGRAGRTPPMDRPGATRAHGGHRLWWGPGGTAVAEIMPDVKTETPCCLLAPDQGSLPIRVPPLWVTLCMT